MSSSAPSFPAADPNISIRSLFLLSNYEDIKSRLGIDFVPNLYKVMAAKPSYLEANWNKVNAVMVEPGKLDRLTKEIVAVAVSAVFGCQY